MPPLLAQEAHVSAFDVACARACCRMEQAKHREEELGGASGHLVQLGVPADALHFSGDPVKRVRNTVLQAATQLTTQTGHQCHQRCVADSRCVHP